MGKGARDGPGSCEHAFVSALPAYTRMKTALRRGELLVAWKAAGDLREVAIGDALALLLLALDQDPGRFDRAAARWHARLVADFRLTLAESALALEALRALPTRARVAGAQALAMVCEAHGLDDAADLLDTWGERGA